MSPGNQNLVELFLCTDCSLPLTERYALDPKCTLGPVSKEIQLSLTGTLSSLCQAIYLRLLFIFFNLCSL